MDDGLIRCTECGWAVDEFTTIAERWLYYSDGCGDLFSYCPGCATREFADDEPAARSVGLPPLLRKLVVERRDHDQDRHRSRYHEARTSTGLGRPSRVASALVRTSSCVASPGLAGRTDTRMQ